MEERAAVEDGGLEEAVGVDPRPAIFALSPMQRLWGAYRDCRARAGLSIPPMQDMELPLELERLAGCSSLQENV